MSNINCGIGVLHVKRQILTYFFVTSFICSLRFLLFQLIGHTKSSHVIIYQIILRKKYDSMAKTRLFWGLQRRLSGKTKVEVGISTNGTSHARCTAVACFESMSVIYGDNVWHHSQSFLIMTKGWKCHGMQRALYIANKLN